METIEDLNKRLKERYGQYLDGQPMFRVVFSEDVLEKQIRTHTDEGFQLLTPEVKEVPKYRQWIKGKHVLEGLKEVPLFQQGEVINKISYEPIWVFEDGNGNPVPPVWLAIEVILESVRCAMEGTNGVKYVDPMIAEKDNPEEARRSKLKEIQEALFPNETDVGDALAYKEAVGFTTSKEFTGTENVVTRNYTKES